MGRLLVDTDNATLAPVPIVTNWQYQFYSLSAIFGSAFPGILATQFVTRGLTELATSQSQITQTSPTTGVFRTSTLEWVVGQQVVINNDTNILTTARVVSITTVSPGLYETTLDSAYTTAATLYCMASARYSERVWFIAVLSVGSFTDVYYIKPTFNKYDPLSSGSDRFCLFDIDYFFRLGEEELTDIATSNPFNGLLTGGYFGGVPMATRAYFDLAIPTIDKQNTEFWLTREADDNGTTLVAPIIRFYIQYEESSGTTASPAIRSFALTRDYVPGDADGSPTGLAWFNKTEVPSVLLKEFGFEIIDANSTETELFNFTSKVSPSS
jgi:hypothetical protein